MKKNYFNLLVLLLVGFVANAQTKVTFRINMKNETISSNGLHIPGNYVAAAMLGNDWDPNQAGVEAKDPDGDKIYELQVTLPPGNYQYKFVNDNSWSGGGVENVPSACQAVGGNREVTVGSTDIVLPVVCFGSCADCPSTVFERDVKYIIIDSSESFSAIKIKGSMTGWADKVAYDDGTNGDAVAGDHKFTLLWKTKEGQWDWGAVDGPCGAWLIKGDNRSFTMSSTGVITGDTTYVIKKLGGAYNVTFRVDMSDEIISSSGIYVSGDFMSALVPSLCNWDKDTLMLFPRTGGSKVYQTTVKLKGTKFSWKFWNGKDPVNQDAPAENADFNMLGCGDGGQYKNRGTDLSMMTKDTVLTLYKFNSCSASTASTKKVGNVTLGLFPNPTKGNATLTLNGNIGNYEVQLLDINGKLISTTLGNSSKTEISTLGLAKGIYFINVLGNGVSITQKLIKN